MPHTQFGHGFGKHHKKHGLRASCAKNVRNIFFPFAEAIGRDKGFFSARLVYALFVGQMIFGCVDVVQLGEVIVLVGWGGSS